MASDETWADCAVSLDGLASGRAGGGVAVGAATAKVAVGAALNEVDGGVASDWFTAIGEAAEGATAVGLAAEVDDALGVTSGEVTAGAGAALCVGEVVGEGGDVAVGAASDETALGAT